MAICTCGGKGVRSGYANIGGPEEQQWQDDSLPPPSALPGMRVRLGSGRPVPTGITTSGRGLCVKHRLWPEEVQKGLCLSPPTDRIVGDSEPDRMRQAQARRSLDPHVTL